MYNKKFISLSDIQTGVNNILNSNEVNSAELKKLDDAFYSFLNNKKMANVNVSIDQVENITFISEDLGIKAINQSLKTPSTDFLIYFIDEVC